MHIDAVDAALGRGGRRTQGQPGRQLRDFAIRQLKRAEKLQRILDRLIGKALDPKATEADKTIDGTFIQAVQTCKALTDTMMNAIEQVRRSDVAEKRKMGDLTDEEIDEVFISQLTRIAPKIEDGDKRVMLAIWFGEEVADVLLREREVVA